jgi:hypothetical protein
MGKRGLAAGLHSKRRNAEGDMDDKDSVLKKIETGIENAAKAVEDFADEVAAPEEPVVIIPDGAVPPKPPAKSG